MVTDNKTKTKWLRVLSASRERGEYKWEARGGRAASQDVGQRKPETLSAPFHGPEVRVPGRAADGVTSMRLPALSMAALSGVRWLTRVRARGAWGRGRTGQRRVCTGLAAVFGSGGGGEVPASIS